MYSSKRSYRRFKTGLLFAPNLKCLFYYTKQKAKAIHKIYSNKKIITNNKYIDSKLFLKLLLSLLSNIKDLHTELHANIDNIDYYQVECRVLGFLEIPSHYRACPCDVSERNLFDNLLQFAVFQARLLTEFAMQTSRCQSRQ